MAGKNVGRSLKKRIFGGLLLVLIVISALLFLLAFLWFMNGSLEVCPTEEQQEKARLAAGIFMAGSGIFGVILIRIRARLFRESQG